MHMVRHDDKGVQMETGVRVMVERLHDYVRYFRHRQVMGAGTGAFEHPVHCQKRGTRS